MRQGWGLAAALVVLASGPRAAHAIQRPSPPALPRLATVQRAGAAGQPLPQLALMHADGSGHRRMPVVMVLPRPAWSRDGWRLAFVRETDGSYTEVFVLEADGAYRRVSDAAPNSAGEPAWSPDGGRIAYTCWCGDQADIHLVGLDGADSRRLTDHPANDQQAAWAPDGRTIVFVSDRAGGRDLWAMNADGSGARRLTDHPGDETQPAFSPDGRRIAFVGTRDGRSDIYAMDAAGGGATRLTDDPAEDAWPAWSPDGTQLAFARGPEDASVIVVMGSDGAGARAVTDPAQAHTAPAWGPPPAAARPDPAPPPAGTLRLPPPAGASAALPVVVFLPFTGGTAEELAELYLAPPPLAPRPGEGPPAYAALIVAGRGSAADYATGPNWSSTIERYERQVLADLRRFAADQPIDTTRVVLTGFSLGGDLAWALALRNPDRFLGAVVMGSRASYRATAANHQALASARRRFVFALGAGEDAARVAGAQTAAELLTRLGVEHRMTTAGSGHTAAPAPLFSDALVFILGAGR